MVEFRQRDRFAGAVDFQSSTFRSISTFWECFSSCEDHDRLSLLLRKTWRYLRVICCIDRWSSHTSTDFESKRKRRSPSYLQESCSNKQECHQNKGLKESGKNIAKRHSPFLEKNLSHHDQVFLEDCIRLRTCRLNWVQPILDDLALNDTWIFDIVEKKFGNRSEVPIAWIDLDEESSASRHKRLESVLEEMDVQLLVLDLREARLSAQLNQKAT